MFSPEDIKPELVVAAAFIEFLSKLNNNSSSQKQLWQAQPLWRLNIAYQHSIKLNYLNQNIQIKFASNEDGFTAEYNGQSYPISGQLIDAHTASVQISGSKQSCLLTKVSKALPYSKMDRTISLLIFAKTLIKQIAKPMKAT